MLIFSRKKDEAIMIGSDIEIKVVQVGRDTVKIGISAPRKIAVHRKEIFLAIEEQNRAAAAKMSREQLDQIRRILKKQD